MQDRQGTAVHGCTSAGGTMDGVNLPPYMDVQVMDGVSLPPYMDVQVEAEPWMA